MIKISRYGERNECTEDFKTVGYKHAPFMEHAGLEKAKQETICLEFRKESEKEGLLTL